MKDLRKLIGKRVREVRTKLGLTQEELADRANLHPSFIGQIERGTKTASIQTLDRLANTLNIRLSTLFEFGDNTDTDKYDYLVTEIGKLLKATNPKNKELVYNMTRLIVSGKK